MEVGGNDTLGHKFPIQLDTFQCVNRLLLAAIGIPLDLLIIGVILNNRRLNRKPRNVLWVGVIFSNLCALATILTEFLAFHYESPEGCWIFGSTTGIAYTCLLYNLLLSLCDRYVAIIQPIRHREFVTVTRVVNAQILGAIFASLVIKSPFLLWIPVECGIVPVQAKIISVISSILLVSCLVAHIAVYRKTRQSFREHLSIRFSAGVRLGDAESTVTISSLMVHNSGMREMEVHYEIYIFYSSLEVD